MKNRLKRTILIMFCLLVMTPMSVQAAIFEGINAGANKGSLFLGAIVFAVCIFCIVKTAKKIFFEYRLEGLYEHLAEEDKAAVFSNDKRTFIFVGGLLKQAFPKGNLSQLFDKYVVLYKAHADLGSYLYQTVCYARNRFEDFSEDEVYSMAVIVTLGDDGAKKNADYTAEQIEFYKRKAMSRVKCIEAVAARQAASELKDDVSLGTKDHPILVAGEKGIETYFASLIAEDGTKMEHVHKGTHYIRNKNMDLAYDLRKYSLRDAENGSEMCHLWFNTYGMENCKKCVDGFVLEKDVLDGTISLAQTDFSPETEALEKPSDVVAINEPTIGKPKITWSAVEGADKYFVYRSRGKDSAFVYRGSSTSAEYIDLKAETGSTCYYKVVAADTKNRYARSEHTDAYGVVCVLPAPVLTVGSEEGTGKVKLTWDPVEGAQWYVIYRSTSEDGDYIRMYRQKGTSYVNAARIEPHVTYYYKVCAVHENDAANSPCSEIVSGSWEPPTEEVK